MLVDPTFPTLDPQTATILSIIGSLGGRGGGTTRIAKGMYEIPHFSMDHMLGDAWGHPREERYRRYAAGDKSALDEDRMDVPEGGVCDTPEQFAERYAAILEASPREFVVSFTRINKKDQSPDGGWRWHKWGEYIGTKSPKYEYIYDEGPEIETVYCFSLLVKLPETPEKPASI